ncbi:hypothetical protein WEN_01640 [Mycoplasma wenyonii str. Massachusetts]|uniref:Uncharacterized protein n=1 Tax=Mycoplasma wenyonii (strain Massachusetts) TaxID=1197325 RepID=I6YAX5_MYCWM|nr:hypothetical protein [Mycoplasma wenyonii]AFN65121.1 hypothetical protein WEN_01640 [Mycoplasma wenyonii str. Massachusetts]
MDETGNWEYSHKYGGNLICDRNVFHVTKFQDYGGEQQWEKEFKAISLSLVGCEDKSGRKECSINIGSGVDLEWKNDFKPKVII